jgi:hypothetical protein
VLQDFTAGQFEIEAHDRNAVARALDPKALVAFHGDGSGTAVEAVQPLHDRLPFGYGCIGADHE